MPEPPERVGDKRVRLWRWIDRGEGMGHWRIGPTPADTQGFSFEVQWFERDLEARLATALHQLEEAERRAGLSRGAEVAAEIRRERLEAAIRNAFAVLMDPDLDRSSSVTAARDILADFADLPDEVRAALADSEGRSLPPPGGESDG